MYKTIILITLVIFGLNQNLAFSGEKITDENWLNHPEIKKIRSIYNTIITESQQYEYRSITQNCSPEPNNRFKRESGVLINTNDVIREYTLSSTNEGTAEDTKYYYSEKGILRFMLFSCDYQNSGNITARIYFDEKGNEIYVNEVKEGDSEYCYSKYDAILKPKDHYQNYCF